MTNTQIGGWRFNFEQMTAEGPGPHTTSIHLNTDNGHVSTFSMKFFYHHTAHQKQLDEAYISWAIEKHLLA